MIVYVKKQRLHNAFKCYVSAVFMDKINIFSTMSSLVEAQPQLVEAQPQLVEAQPQLVEAQLQLV